MDEKKLSKIKKFFNDGLYSCDKAGNVYSHHFGKKKKLKPRNLDGYVKYIFSKGEIKTEVFGHQAVWIFFKIHDGKKQINHKNSIKSDNRLSNLELVTASHNMKHSVKAGTASSFKKKLSGSDVKFIKENLGKIAIVSLAKKFNVSRRLISHIKNGLTWKNI